MAAMDQPARPVVTDAPERERYEAHLDGELAGVLEYAVKRGRLALIHTEVSPAQEGRGVGSSLVRFALDDARRRKLRVIAVCPYVQAYLTRHPEDDDIVVGRGTATSSTKSPRDSRSS
jgi:predicted GNAT family acetyltransferase